MCWLAIILQRATPYFVSIFFYLLEKRMIPIILQDKYNLKACFRNRLKICNHQQSKYLLGLHIYHFEVTFLAYIFFTMANNVVN